MSRILPVTEQVAVALLPGRPLTPMQQPLWTSQRRHVDDPVQNMALLTHIDGDVDPHRLAEAFETVVEASDALRSRIVHHDGTARVQLDASPPERMIEHLARDDVVTWARARASVPLDMGERGYDSVIMVHPDDTVSWYLALHHTVTDATSSALVFAATAQVYHGAEIDLPSYYGWAADLEHPRRPRAEEHWSARTPASVERRLYRTARTPVARADRVEVPLETDLVARLVDRFRGDLAMVSDELAWSTALTTVTTVFLRQIAGIDRCSIGLPVHHRSARQARNVIGPLMEVFPVDVAVEVGDTLRSVHRRVARSTLVTLRNAVPGAAPAPDFTALVNVIPRAQLGAFGRFATSTRWIESGSIDGDHLLRVQLTAWDSSDDPPTLALDVNRAAADEEQAQRAAEHFLAILSSLVDDPDRCAGASIVTPPELELIESWEQAPDFPTTVTDTVELLRDALSDRQDVALRHGDLVLTGAELWRRVVDTAGSLRREGVSRGTRVGIEMPRSADAVVAILATLLAGGSFVPLEPGEPADRRRRLAERAGCRLVLTELPSPDSLVDEAISFVTPSPDEDAYVIFTSGSTGEPKGVPISRRGLARYLRFATETYRAGSDPLVVPLFSALGFDLTITSLFLPLVAGGELVVFEPDGPAGLAALARDRRITWCKATPSHLEVLCRLLPDEHRLRTLVVGGEAFGAGLARRLLEARPGLSIFNEYGPTEAVVGCMVHRVDPHRLDELPEVPIGRPAPGVTLRVIGPELERVPMGATGELCIAHAGLTAGYLGSDADASTDGSPFVELDGRRFYRSGDLVRLADPNTLVFLGRVDDQVKLGGIRLEPAEVVQAIEAHPSIARALVRPWRPRPGRPALRCVRCGLPSDVPGVTFDVDEVCSSCHDYDRVAPQAEQWFGTPDDLVARRDAARRRRTGSYDCIHLLSGGKDSTYALYRLVELGFEPLAFTLDNGFISETAKDNIARTVADLGVDHEFATTEAMTAIFRDSLERHSDVCHGCYKTLYTLATTRAVELGAPMIVTGLSRGQLFETRLIPQQFDVDRFDPDAIDRAVIAARKAYHRADDGVSRLLDTGVFETDAVFDRVEFVDLYRYLDVELSELLDFLSVHAPWVRPADTGRSTNCLINAAGIHTHLVEQGYHNYAIPYAWDVRLGHKTRQQAIDELDDRLDPGEVARLLEAVDYEPSGASVLTAWVELAEGREMPSTAALRRFLAAELPTYAIPRAFLPVDGLPLTVNGKIDLDALPRPARTHRAGGGPRVAPETELERVIVTVWERVLGVEPVGIDDDFFELGGDSLTALKMIALLGAADPVVRVRDEWAFTHRTPRALAARIGAPVEDADRAVVPVAPSSTPGFSSGELALLAAQSRHPDSFAHNAAQLFHVAARVDAARFEAALRQVAGCHVPLSWSYAPERRRLDSDDAVEVEIRSPVAADRLEDVLRVFHRQPFDLVRGPLLRCLVQPVVDGTTAILLVCHHVSVDEHSFGVVWNSVDAVLRGEPVTPPKVDYPSFTAPRTAAETAADRRYWSDAIADVVPSRLALYPPESAADGFVTRRARVRARDLGALSAATPFATILAALVATLRRYADGDTIEIGALATTRDGADADAIVGFLLNTLPVALDCSTGDELGELTTRAARRVADHLAHRHHPAAAIADDRRAAQRPLPALDVVLAHRDWRATSLLGAAVEQRALSVGASVYDATFFVEVRGDEVDLGLEYRGSVIAAEVADGLLADFDTMLAATVGAPAKTVGSVELSTAGSGMLVGPPADPPESVVPLILDHTATRGDAAAIVCGGRHVSWHELGERSEALAGRLRGAGVAPGDRVIVEVPRSPELVVAVLAVLRAGAAYVPVDPGYPDGRRREMIDGAGAPTRIVADTDTGSDAEGDLRIEPIAGEAAAALRGSRADRSAEAYVMFTSGSTGRPRAVAVGHAQLAASTAARRSWYGRPPERFLVVSSPSFDSSVAGLFWTLTVGGTVVLPTEPEVHDPALLIDLFESAAVTDTLMVPTLYRALLDGAAEGVVNWPDRVIVAGESCPRQLVDRHLDRWPDTDLVNEYGPTEATVWATAHRCRRGRGPVPIGRPVEGTWVAVVDDGDRVLPAGVEGQLIVGGGGVVDGYDDDVAASAEQFGAGPNGRFFRTGDRTVVVDGEVRFLGRRDHQLNVGGVRVEPEEIERVLLADPRVAAAVVTSQDLRSLDELVSACDPDQLAAAMHAAARAADPGTELRRRLAGADGSGRRIVAHLEPLPGGRVDLDAVRRRAGIELPATSRPAAYAVHRQLPRSPSGKVDRSAAAELDVDVVTETGARTAPGVAPDGLVELVGQHFARVLRIERVDADDSFFDLGGHSLLALELVMSLERELGLSFTVSSVYERPTPAGLAALAEPPGSATSSAPFLVPIQHHGDRPPIFGIHVLGVDCEFYRPLARRLGERQPVFGLGQPTARPDTTRPTDVVEVARLYVGEIERCAPDGPVVLAAVSLGGVVAFEVAQQLRARGRVVALLVLFDAVGPDGPALAPTKRERLALHVRALRSDPPTYLADRVRRVRERTVRRSEIVRLRLRRELGLAVDDRLLVREFVEDNWRSQGEYSFAPYDGPMRVFKAGDDRFTAGLAEHGLGWRSVARGSLDVSVVPGDHLSILREPHVGRVADELEQALVAIEIARPIDRPELERELCAALADGTFAPTVTHRLTSGDELTEGARALLVECDRATRALAFAALRHGRAALEALERSGIRSRLDTTPDRTQYGLATLRIDATGASDDVIDHAVTALTVMGYQPDAPGGSHTRHLIHRDEPSFRLVLDWGDPSRRMPTPPSTFLATPTGIVEQVMALAEPTAHDVVLDLGCGDGRVLIEAARAFGCRGRGIERDPAQLEQARANVAAAGYADRIRVRAGDATAASITDATVVFVFLPGELAAAVVPDVLARLPEGGRVLAHEQVAPVWPVTPDASRLIVGDGITVAHVWRKV